MVERMEVCIYGPKPGVTWTCVVVIAYVLVVVTAKY